MRPSASRHYQLGLLLVTASAVIWSTAGLFTRLVSADTVTILLWRGTFGAAGLLLFGAFWVRGSVWQDTVRMGWPGWLFAVVSGAGMIFFIFALRHTSVAHVAIIYAAVPFIAGAMAWAVMGEAMSRNAIVASLLALAGVVVMVGAGTGEGGLWGDMLALLMTVCLAVMMVISRRHRDVPMLPAAGLSAALSALAVLPFAAPLAVAPADWWWLLAFGLVNSALGFALFMIGARFLPPAETGLIGALDAPLAPLWVWLVFSETPTGATLIGGTIVFGAVLVFLLSGLWRDRTRTAA